MKKLCFLLALLLLLTGDMWQGSSESHLTRGFIITEWMNDLDFTAMTVGGHEFDWGDGFSDYEIPINSSICARISGSLW